MIIGAIIREHRRAMILGLAIIRMITVLEPATCLLEMGMIRVVMTEDLPQAIVMAHTLPPLCEVVPGRLQGLALIMINSHQGIIIPTIAGGL